MKLKQIAFLMIAGALASITSDVLDAKTLRVEVAYDIINQNTGEQIDNNQFSFAAQDTDTVGDALKEIKKLLRAKGPYRIFKIEVINPTGARIDISINRSLDADLLSPYAYFGLVTFYMTAIFAGPEELEEKITEELE